MYQSAFMTTTTEIYANSEIILKYEGYKINTTLFYFLAS